MAQAKSDGSARLNPQPIVSLQRRLAAQKEELERANARLFEQGRIDPLTEIPNRRRMQEDLEALFSRAQRYGQSFAVALCDIDYFKAYNDTCGHQAVDQILHKTAQTLRSKLRACDTVYRYGGEEFLLVLPEQSVDTAFQVVERIRCDIESLGIFHPGKPASGVLTLSAGLAVLSRVSPRAWTAF